MHDSRVYFTGLCDRGQPQFRDHTQNFLEDVSWNSESDCLEEVVAIVADDLRTDFNQFFLQARWRRLFHRLGRRLHPQGVAVIVDEGIKRKANPLNGK